MLTDDDSVVLYMRRGCHVCARVKRYLTEHDIPFSTRDVDVEPLTPHELWGIFNRKAGRLRVPFTVLNDGEDVVLGYDPLRLEGVFIQADLGGWQASTVVTDTFVYDEFTTSGLDSNRWRVEDESELLAELTTGEGTLVMGLTAPKPGPHDDGAAATIRSAERFATSRDRCVVFEGAAGVEASTPSPSGRILIGVEDFAGRITFGFELVHEQVWALHRRTAEPGVTLAEEAFSHRVLVDGYSPIGNHRYSIAYDSTATRVSWYVDGTSVYWASPPGPVEGCSLLMSVAPTPRLAGPGPGNEFASPRVTWSPWRIATAAGATSESDLAL